METVITVRRGIAISLYAGTYYVKRKVVRRILGIFPVKEDEYWYVANRIHSHPTCTLWLERNGVKELIDIHETREVLIGTKETF